MGLFNRLFKKQKPKIYIEVGHWATIELGDGCLIAKTTECVNGTDIEIRACFRRKEGEAQLYSLELPSGDIEVDVSLDTEDNQPVVDSVNFTPDKGEQIADDATTLPVFHEPISTVKQDVIIPPELPNNDESFVLEAESPIVKEQIPPVVEPLIKQQDKTTQPIETVQQTTVSNKQPAIPPFWLVRANIVLRDVNHLNVELPRALPIYAGDEVVGAMRTTEIQGLGISTVLIMVCHINKLYKMYSALGAFHEPPENYRVVADVEESETDPTKLSITKLSITPKKSDNTNLDTVKIGKVGDKL